jgi:hypothetical protein
LKRPSHPFCHITTISMVTIGLRALLTIVVLHHCFVVLLPIRRYLCLLLLLLLTSLPLYFPSTYHRIFLVLHFINHSTILHNGLVPCIIAFIRHLSHLAMSRRAKYLYAMGMDIDSTHVQTDEPNYIESLAEIRYQFESIQFTAPNCPIDLPSLSLVNHKY